MADAPIPALKRCSKCRCDKPATPDHFNRQKHSVSGLYSQCRDCARAALKARYAADPEKYLSSFRKARAENPEFHRARDREYFQKHRERKRVAAKLYRDAHATECAARLKEWKAANPDKVHAANERRKAKRGDVQRQQGAYNMRRWRANNPVAAGAARDKRRAREVGAEGEYTREDVLVLLKVQGRRCFYCDSKLTRFECDHFVPLARGGTNKPENIVLACKPCNIRKWAKMPWEWMPDRFAEGCAPR